MISAFRSAVRRTFIGAVVRWPALGGALTRLLGRLPRGPAAARLYLWVGQARARTADYDGAVACFDEAIARRPRLPSAHHRRAEMYARKGEWARAADDLRRELALLPAGQSPSLRLRERLLHCHENLGQLLVCQGRLEAALGHFDAAIAARPEHGPLYFRRGECRQALGRYDLALEDYLSGMAYRLASRELTAGLRGVGRLLARAGQAAEGAAFYFAALPARAGAPGPRAEAAAARRPDLTPLAEARDQLADHLAGGGDDSPLARPVCIEDGAVRRRGGRPSRLREGGPAAKCLAKKAFICLFRRCPRLSAALFRLLKSAPFGGPAARLYIWLGLAKSAAGEPDAALACFERAVALRPALALARACRGEQYYARGDLARAAEDWKAAARTPHLGAPLGDLLAQCHQKLGEALALQGQPQAAAEHYGAAVALRPDLAVLYLRRGECRHADGRPGHALDDYRTALHSRPGGWELVGLFYALGRLLACEGRIEEGVAFYVAATGMNDCIRRTPPARWGAGGRPTGQLDPLWVMRAHDTLAEDLMNGFGAVALARRVYRRKLDLQQTASATDPLTESGALVLPEDWVRQIGHMGFLDSWLKMNRLGWRSWPRIYLLAPPERTANRHYLTYWDGHVTVLTDPQVCQALAPVAAAHAFRVASGVELPGCSHLLYFFEAVGLVQQEWEAQGRPPLLTLTAEDEERGWQVLGNLGLPRGAWFVCLHARESGFHNAGDCKHQAHRNANILDYQLAVREVTRRGGWVVRMGDPSMTPLPPMERVLDYAHSPAKADWMDVFLCGQCRFFIGLASGLSQVATTFGAPCVYVNWISNVLPPFSVRDLFIPKLFRPAGADEPLSFAAMYAPAALDLNCNNHLLMRRGLGVVDNDPAEIRDAVVEMLDQLDDHCSYDTEDHALQERLDRVMGRHGHRGYCRMGKAFLRKHRRLLPAVPAALPQQQLAAAA